MTNGGWQEIGARRFVVLEHEWGGVHWDFMLEDGDHLRTWAIDQPIVAGADLAARALPDHRLVYLTYEGSISGARGTVKRIDAGSFLPVEWGPDRVRVILAGAQLVGDVVLYRSDSGSPDSSPWKFRLGKVD
jgi:hypothetical protein